MVRVDDIETARIAEHTREVAGAGRRGDSGREQIDVCPWHELEYAAVVSDSDRILAAALTPAAGVLLTRLAAGTLAPRLAAAPIVLLRSSYRVPVMRPRATQRSPPR